MTSDCEEGASRVVTPPPIRCGASWLWAGLAVVVVCMAGTGAVLSVALRSAPPPDGTFLHVFSYAFSVYVTGYVLSVVVTGAIAALPEKIAEAWRDGEWGRVIAGAVLWISGETCIALWLLPVVATAAMPQVPSLDRFGISELYPFVGALAIALFAGLLPYAVTGRRPRAATSTVDIQHDKRLPVPAQPTKASRPTPSVTLTSAQRAIAELLVAVCRGDQVPGIRLRGANTIAFTQAALARHLGLAKSTVNASLKRLAKLGIVMRHPASRVTVVTLVAKQWLPGRAAGDGPSGCAGIKAPNPGLSSPSEHPLPGHATCNQVHAPRVSLHPLKSDQASLQTISIR